MMSCPGSSSSCSSSSEKIITEDNAQQQQQQQDEEAAPSSSSSPSPVLSRPKTGGPPDPRIIPVKKQQQQQQQRLPRNNREYGTKEYWENRFVAEESYEWLLSYQQLAPQLEPILLKYATAAAAVNGCSDKAAVRILVVGCGNAPFSADLYDAGYTNITNIDYSDTVICAMRKLHHKQRPGMQWHVMDMCDMHALPDASFDVVIDKAAMDALMTADGEGDVWNPAASVIAASYAMCRHVSRVLMTVPPPAPNHNNKSAAATGGTFVQISLAQPHFRKKYLLGWHHDSAGGDGDALFAGDDDATVMATTTTTNDDTYSARFGWTFRSEAAGRDDAESGGCFGHYLYIMTKR